MQFQSIPIGVFVPLCNRAGIVVGHALVDAADFDMVSHFRWFPFVQRQFTYAACRQRKVCGGRTLLMHRLITGRTWDDGLTVDHRNHDTLDNRRDNLRTCTRGQNSQNLLARKIMGARGVTFEQGKWRARGKLNGRKVNIGRFASFDDAAKAASDWRAEFMPFSNEGL